MSYLMNPSGADLIIKSIQRDLSIERSVRRGSAAAKVGRDITAGMAWSAFRGAARQVSSAVRELVGGLPGRPQHL